VVLTVARLDALAVEPSVINLQALRKDCRGSPAVKVLGDLDQVRKMRSVPDAAMKGEAAEKLTVLGG
jgi:hypothetical protein